MYFGLYFGLILHKMTINNKFAQVLLDVATFARNVNAEVKIHMRPHRHYRIVAFTSLLLVSIFTGNRSNAAQVSLFFAGGQSNAKVSWANAIEQGLVDSGRYNDIEFVHVQHSGAWLTKWVNAPAIWGPDARLTGDFYRTENYQYDFFNSTGTGVLQQKIQEIRSRGDTFRFEGFFWFQGEGDSSTALTRNTYADRFEAMLGFLAQDMVVDYPLPFAITQISYNSNYNLPSSQTADVIQIMREQQGLIAARNPLGVAVDSHDYDRVDLWHLPGSELSRLGTDTADQFLVAVPEPTTVSIMLLACAGLLRRRGN